MVQSIYYARLAPSKLVIFTSDLKVLRCRHVYKPVSGLIVMVHAGYNVIYQILSYSEFPT